MMAGGRIVAGIVSGICALAPYCAAGTMMLSGRVTMEDGSVPLRAAVIERVCDGKPERIASTNAKGEYVWHTTPNRGAIALSNVVSSAVVQTLYDRPHDVCQLRAVMPGYESNIVEVEDATALMSPVLQTFVLVRRGTQLQLDTSGASVPRSASAAWGRVDKEIRRK